jgi:hypothetical protein
MKPIRLTKHAREQMRRARCNRRGSAPCHRRRLARAGETRERMLSFKTFRSSKLGRASIIQLIYCSSGLVAAPHLDTKWLQRPHLEGIAIHDLAQHRSAIHECALAASLSRGLSSSANRRIASKHGNTKTHVNTVSQVARRLAPLAPGNVSVVLHPRSWPKTG